MKNRKLHITIPEPCAENWDKMLPEEQGRFCNSCQKVVIDFTSMSDEELVSYFAEYTSENTCGRFNNKQIDRTLTLEHKRRWHLNIDKRIAAALIAVQAVLFNVKSYALPKAQIEVLPTDNTKGDQVKAITGVVVDYLTNKPIGGVRVVIEHTDYFAITDVKGGFAISVYESTVKGKLTVSVSDSNTANGVYWQKSGTLDELANKNFTLYKYPEGEIDKVDIVDYKVPMVTTGEVIRMGGMRHQTEIIPVKRKLNFWQRITKPFRKKR